LVHRHQILFWLRGPPAATTRSSKGTRAGPWLRREGDGGVVISPTAAAAD